MQNLFQEVIPANERVTRPAINLFRGLEEDFKLLRSRYYTDTLSFGQLAVYPIVGIPEQTAGERPELPPHTN